MLKRDAVLEFMWSAFRAMNQLVWIVPGLHSNRDVPDIAPTPPSPYLFPSLGHPV